MWLPTYAPWLNPIEKLWRWLRQDVLKMHRLASRWSELKERVRTFLNQFAQGSTRLLEYTLGEGEPTCTQAMRGGPGSKQHRSR